MALAECLYQLDLKRQMVRVIRRDAVQFIKQLWSDPLRLAMRHPMYHPVSYGFDRSERLLRFEPIQQTADGRTTIAGVDGATILRLSGSILEGQIRAAQTDTIHFPIQQPSRRFAHIKQCEPDAGRAAVYR